MMVAVGFLGLDVPPSAMPPALLTLHRWLDSWSGIGIIERGMTRQGYDLSLTRFANEGWRATFYLWGMAHSFTSTTGSAWEKTPWQAVQRAAWDALTRMERQPAA
jgi:hypothetical protein